jgi:hypothetical protein
MSQSKAQCLGPDAERDCGSSVNDNEQPPTNTVTLTELAVAMQVDEDALLKRLAEILCKRNAGAGASDEAAG